MNLSSVRFPGKHDQERVLFVYHRHWFDILSHLFIPIFLSVVLVSLPVAMPGLSRSVFPEDAAAFFVFLGSSFHLFLWLYLFLVWIDVYFDVWIVTDERIVNVEQKDLFTRRTSELRFSRVQDVTSEVQGVIPSILNYGDVHVQTAGEQARFIFHNVPDPVAIKDLVMKLAQRGRRESGDGRA